MPETRPPAEDTCGRCKQTRPLFAAKTEWGRVPPLLCSPCWSRYADARARNTFVDFNDAFDNATDEQLSDALGLNA
ncbi:hypothetical protein ACF09L_19080 [Streptomyces sp. NPDC014779]|uniref:hypothetical protein n=1 Tax=Streptomyces sp. NPDC014779 TaxID=3364911 RepID=UPI0036F91876